MGGRGEQAAGVMSIVREAAARRDGREPDHDSIRRQHEAIVSQFDTESRALYATARLWDDGIIDPRDTRRVLGFCLGICAEAEMRPLSPSTFGVARL